MSAVSPRRRARSYAYVAVTVAVVLVFALGEWWTAKFISDRSRVASTVIEIAIVLFAALAFRPFHVRVEAAVDAAFTRQRRQAIEAVAKFRRELTSFNDRAQLLRRVIEAVDRYLDTMACAIYVRRELYHAEASSFDTPAPDVDIDDPLAVRLRSTGGPAPPEALQSSAIGTHAFPMTVAGDLIGFVCVHAKFGSFEPEEDQALTMLAESLATALSQLDPLLRVENLAVPNNLPADLPPLIGRGDEIAEIKSLLAQSRLVTLTGAGGVGKTRLAVHVASEMRSNPDGIWFVDLAPLDDPTLVASAIASVFSIADEGGNRTLIERVSNALKTRQLLILLDNCEHLIAAAATAAEHLLQRCPRVQIIATSREPLGVSGEEAYRVPSLPVPSPMERTTAAAVANVPAVSLFVARARSAERSFALTDENADAVADIVRALDGIAMALELAAPRLKVLTVEELRARLDERFNLLNGGNRTALPRHQTLRALIGWSYDLLGDAEKALLRRCAVFRGDWTRDAAEALAPDREPSDWGTLDLLEALVDKSLITVQSAEGSRRYRLSESTRQFALECLNEAGERDIVSMRYTRYFAARAQKTGETHWSTDSDGWMASVREDLENYRGAIAAGLSGGDAVAATQIVGNLRWYWYAIARREGSTLVSRATALCDERMPLAVRGLLALADALLDTSAKAIDAATNAASLIRGDASGFASIEARTLEATALARAARRDEAHERFSAALASARETHEPRLIGWVLSMVAYWYGAWGDAPQARALFDEAAETLRASGDAWQVARLHVHRAEFLYSQADPAGALASVHEAESVFRARGSDTGLCVALLNATAYLLSMERFGEAWESAREGLQLALHLDNAMPCAWAIGHLAELAAEAGDMSRCARLLGHADAIYTQTGSTREPTEQRGYDRARRLVQRAIGEKEMFAFMSAGAATEISFIVDEALAVARPQMRMKVLH